MYTTRRKHKVNEIQPRVNRHFYQAFVWEFGNSVRALNGALIPAGLGNIRLFQTARERAVPNQDSIPGLEQK